MKILDLIALVLVALAVAFLLRRQWRSRKAAGGSCSGCGRCGPDPVCDSRQHRVG